MSTICVTLPARTASRITWSAGLVAMACLTMAAPAPAQPSPSQPSTRLPARLVTCLLGHATNFNPERQQKLGDITFDTHHRLTLFLPGISARTTPPPDAIEPAETVDPDTRLIEDPDGLSSDAPGPFNRVVDVWPERVELAKTTETGAYKAFLVSNYDATRGTARMFIGTATDLVTYDLKRIYMGDCIVTLNPPAPPKAP